MPAWLRVALLQELSTEQVARVHRILDDLLTSIGCRDIPVIRRLAAFPPT
jgi:hypothetical protein